MKVNVKFENDEVKELYLKASKGETIFPFKTYDKDFCYDVVATSCEEVAPDVYKYNIGLSFQIERGEETILQATENIFGQKEMLKTIIDLKKSPINLSIDARPRSSIWKTGMSLCNCEGTVDELYIGKVACYFYHVKPNMPKYEIGDKIAQIKIGITLPMEFKETKELMPTERGEGGFGSTGK